MILLLAFALIPSQGKAERVSHVLNGKIKEVRAGEGKVVLAYFHPVTRKVEELTLKVGRETGFAEGVTLDNLRRDEPVSVDYLDASPDLPQVLRIERVPLTGIPIEKSPR